jgi:hypothetical protein
MALTADRQSAHDVADQIESFRSLFLATETITEVLFEAPNFEQILSSMDLTLPRGSVVESRRKDGSYYATSVDLREAVDKVKLNTDLLVTFSKALLMSFISLIGDEVQRNSLYSKFSSPELEFLRHIRNAVSHGNQFFFKSYDDGTQEPKRPASFKQFTLAPSLDGSSLWDFIWPGDLLELLDHVAIYLRQV